MGDTLIIVFQITALIFSVIVHEVAHGFMAFRLGDDTAYRAGRLTLNPVRHIDPFGTIVLPLILFVVNSPILLGWAKPVPYNPSALYKDFKYGSLKVAAAGPLSNIALAVIFAIMIRVGLGFFEPIVIYLLSLVVLLNCILAIFNLLPIPPLDGSKILAAFLPHRYAAMIESIGLNGLIFTIFFLYLFSGVIWSLAVFLFMVLVGGDAVSIFSTFNA